MSSSSPLLGRESLTFSIFSSQSLFQLALGELENRTTARFAKAIGLKLSEIKWKEVPWTSIVGGMLVASLVCLMPMFSSQSDDSRNYKDLQFAFLTRHTQLYNFRLEKIENTKRNGLVMAREQYLNGDFEGCLNSLRQPITTRLQGRARHG